MCRMFLAKNPKIRDTRLLVNSLINSQGGGGIGAAWKAEIDVGDEKKPVFNIIRDNRPTQQDVNGLASTPISKLMESDYKDIIMWHCRGPLGKVNLNHPHSPMAHKVEERFIGDYRSYGASESVMVHNGDTSRDVLAYFIARLVAIGYDVDDLMKKIDTQIIAELLHNFGKDALSIQDKCGSVIWSTVEGTNVFRNGCKGGDYTELFLIRWDDDSWMICSELPRGVDENYYGYKIKEGWHSLESITSLSEASVTLMPNRMKIDRNSVFRELNESLLKIQDFIEREYEIEL